MAADAAHPDLERFRPFTYLTTPNAGLYRRVMLAFVAAKRRFVVHLRSEDVLAELAAEAPANPKTVDDALAQLVDWPRTPRRSWDRCSGRSTCTNWTPRRSAPTRTG